MQIIFSLFILVDLLGSGTAADSCGVVKVPENKASTVSNVRVSVASGGQVFPAKWRPVFWRGREVLLLDQGSAQIRNLDGVPLSASPDDSIAEEAIAELGTPLRVGCYGMRCWALKIGTNSWLSLEPNTRPASQEAKLSRIKEPWTQVRLEALLADGAILALADAAPRDSGNSRVSLLLVNSMGDVLSQFPVTSSPLQVVLASGQITMQFHRSPFSHARLAAISPDGQLLQTMRSSSNSATFTVIRASDAHLRRCVRLEWPTSSEARTNEIKASWMLRQLQALRDRGASDDQLKVFSDALQSALATSPSPEEVSDHFVDDDGWILVRTLSSDSVTRWLVMSPTSNSISSINLASEWQVERFAFPELYLIRRRPELGSWELVTARIVGAD